MDPNAAWKELAQTFQDQDKDRRIEIALGLLEWLDKGGFPPTISGHLGFDLVVSKQTCRALTKHWYRIHGK